MSGGKATHFLNNNMNTLEITKNILKKNGIFAKKKFGQNFLVDDAVLEKIIEKSNITSEDLVIEIGPGLGNLTKYILDRSCEVIAFEIDNDMINILNNRFKDKKISIFNADILKVDLNQYIKSKKVKVVANIPYYITSPIIFKLLEYKDKIDSITIMVQKEVAKRIVAKEGSKDYGALTINTNIFCDTEEIVEVNRNCFIPAPNVDSEVVYLKVNNKYDINDIEKFSRLIKVAFSSRRKTILNSLSNMHYNDMTKDEIIKVLNDLSINYNKRPEEITIEEYVKLFNYNKK